MHKSPSTPGPINTIKHKIYVLILTLIFIELFLQLVSAFRYLYFSYTYNGQQKQLIANNWFLRDPKNKPTIDDASGVYLAYHPLVGWLANPIQTKTVNVTQERLRVTMHNPPSGDTAVPNIFMFGGSAVWGYGTSDDKTIPSDVAQILNTPSYAYRVTNYGQIAFNSNQELMYLLLQLKINRIPKMVIFYDGCNDLFYNLGNTTNESVFYEERIKKQLANMSSFFQTEHPTNLSIFNIDILQNLAAGAPTYFKLYYYPAKIYEKVRSLFLRDNKPVGIPVLDNETMVEKIADNYIANANAIDALSRSYGFQYILVWQPLLFSKAHLSSEEMSLQTYSPDHPGLLYQLTTRKLYGAGIKNFYDLTGAFDNNNQSLYIDSCHVSSEGNEIISQGIVDILRNDFQL